MYSRTICSAEYTSQATSCKIMRSKNHSGTLPVCCRVSRKYAFRETHTGNDNYYTDVMHTCQICLLQKPKRFALKQQAQANESSCATLATFPPNLSPTRTKQQPCINVIGMWKPRRLEKATIGYLCQHRSDTNLCRGLCS